MPVMPTFSTGQPFSASLMNDLSQWLRTLKAIADMERVPFQYATGGDTGYIQHAYDDLDWDIATAAVTISYGGQSLGSLGPGTGTFDLSTLGTPPTVGQVYTLTTSGSGTIRYLSERYDPTYTAMSAFVDTNTLTAAELNAISDRTDELINLANANPASFGYHINSITSWDRDDDSEETIWQGMFRYTGDNAVFRFEHDAQSSSSSAKSKMSVYVNGTRLVARSVGDATPSGWTISAQHPSPTVSGKHRLGENVTGTADLSGLSLTVGNTYGMSFRQKGVGTSKSMALKSRVKYFATSASGASWSDLPTWAHGGQNVSAARMNLYRTAIMGLYPGSGGVTAPIYYDNLAQFYLTNQTRRQMKRTQKYLVYIWDGSGRPELDFNGTGKALRAGVQTAQWVDLDRIDGLRYGDHLAIDDIVYAQLTDDVSQL